MHCHEKPLLPYYIGHYCKPSPKEYLMHYGVKGMKWGVRRTPEELGYNKESIIARVNRKELSVTTANGVQVAIMSDHAGDQAQSRHIKTEEIIDALTTPLYTKPVKVDLQGRPSQQFIGNYATVCVNPTDGTLSSMWRTGTDTRKKYQKGG